MTPNNPMTEGEALAVDVSKVSAQEAKALGRADFCNFLRYCAEQEPAGSTYNTILNECSSRILTAHTAASGGACAFCGGTGMIDESPDGDSGTRCMECVPNHRPDGNADVFGHVYRVAPEGFRDRPWKAPGVVFEFGPAPADDGGVMQYLNLYTRPPAAVLADSLQRVVDTWLRRAKREDEDGEKYETEGSATRLRVCADELAALIPKGADHEQR